MLFEGKYYETQAKDLQQRERKIKAARGKILDRNGVVLADNKSVCTISVIHNQINHVISSCRDGACPVSHHLIISFKAKTSWNNFKKK
jgi:cell division protein FtsI/penicillin-binding protein 2